MDQVPLPECFVCKTNEHVVENGPEMAGSEYFCKECGEHWVQET